MYPATIIFTHMRTFFTLLLLLPFCVKAQDCKLKRQKDTYTKEIKISTGFISLEGALLSIEATKTEIDFLFSLGANKCFDDASTAAVNFEGIRYKTNFKNSGTMNCEGLFHFTFRNTAMTPTALQNLAVKKISSIRFKDNSKKETEVKLTAEQQLMLINLTTCVINEAKKLLQ